MDSSLQSRSSAALSLLTFRNLILVLVGYVFARVLYQIVHYRWFHPLSKFPGPFWASVTRLWIASVPASFRDSVPDPTCRVRGTDEKGRYHNFKEDEHLVCLELHKKYGTELSHYCTSSQSPDIP